MKRFPFFILFVLLLVPLNACGNVITGTVSNPEWTAVWQTMTATAWTITPVPTLDPNESKIVEWLNDELLNSDALEQTLEARYQVTDVTFPVSSNGTPVFIRIDIRCECASMNGQCCTSERIFLKVIKAMEKRHDKIIEQVPNTVSELRVVCYNHSSYFDTMAASWPDVKSYLRGEINGYQFGARVFRSTIP